MAALLEILQDHLTRTLEMQVRDVYKLLHQAALGNAHLISSRQEARLRLKREMQQMGEGPADPLVDPISPDGRLVRIHLRPYQRSGKSPAVLLRAFLRSADAWKGSPAVLKKYMQETLQFARHGLLSLEEKDLAEFFANMEMQQFPALHHSEVYNRLYRPAYRVVTSDFLEEL
jgi:hypothetical protein